MLSALFVVLQRLKMKVWIQVVFLDNEETGMRKWYREGQTGNKGWLARHLHLREPDILEPSHQRKEQAKYLYTTLISYWLRAARVSTFSLVLHTQGTAATWERALGQGHRCWVLGFRWCATKWKGKGDMDKASVVSILKGTVVSFWKFIWMWSLVLWVCLMAHDLILLMK